MLFQHFLPIRLWPKKGVDAKTGKDVFIPLTADIIDYIDGYDATINKYLQVNDPGRLQTLAAIWNNWLGTWPQTFSMSLSELGTEGGINVLCSINMTRDFVDFGPSSKVSPTARKMVKAHDDTGIVDLRVAKKKYLSKSIYTDRSVVATTSQSAFLAAPYEQIQNIWILPGNNISGSTAPAGGTFYTRYQSMQSEVYTAVSSSGSDGEILANKNYTYAAKMVHGREAPPSDWEQLFTEAAKRGRGGILSGLIANFVGSAFGSTAGGVANAVADLLPV